MRLDLARVMYCGARIGPGGELFDGASGTNSQSRYSPREEIFRRIEERRMKRLMEATLEETERKEQSKSDRSFSGRDPWKTCSRCCEPIFCNIE